MNPGMSLVDIECGRYTLSFFRGNSTGYTGNAYARTGTPKHQKRNKVRAKMARASRKANRR